MILDKPAIVIVPGFNEPEKDMLTLSDGRRQLPGLSARGYYCEIFPQYESTLSERIDLFADFLTELKSRGIPFPVVTLGYSLGGLVVRGFLRRFPERTADVLHTITLGAPHWGITVDILPMLAAFLRLRDHAIRDLDIRSDFMQWLNQSGGHWEGRWRPWDRRRDWVLDSEPWIGPEGACVFSIYGNVPHFGDDNDGIVWKDSATLGGRIRSHELRYEKANHLNLIGAFNLGTWLIKGFRFNDNVWPAAIAAIADHIESHVMAEPAARLAAAEASS
ncbi:MAG: hypothetical protein GIW95_01975 [Candidatus Eremiobacteraeota bacterium]|nr:hypothetical protein [Candidatus Eremiobacteraeota bacterium]